jgi:hypothetical protein
MVLSSPSIASGLLLYSEWRGHSRELEGTTFGLDNLDNLDSFIQKQAR